MDTQKAMDMIKRLHADELTNEEIAAKLAKAGYKSERTGKPLAAHGIGYHIRAMEREGTLLLTERPKAQPSRRVTRKTLGASNERKVELAQEVLTLADMSTEAKVEAVKLLLEG